MSRPAVRTHKIGVYNTQARQILVLLLITLIVAIYDSVQGLQFVATKSVFAGALLQFVAQSIFTYFAYRKTGAGASQQIMLNMYLGQIIKWLFSLMGFALIFIYLHPIGAGLVIVGYFAMQLCHIFAIRRIPIGYK